MKRAQIKVEYGQLHEMAAAFVAPLLGTALVVISGSFRLTGQETRVGFPSIIAKVSMWTTKAVPSNGAPKAPPI